MPSIWVLTGRDEEKDKWGFYIAGFLLWIKDDPWTTLKILQVLSVSVRATHARKRRALKNEIGAKEIAGSSVPSRWLSVAALAAYQLENCCYEFMFSITVNVIVKYSVSCWLPSWSNFTPPKKRRQKKRSWLNCCHPKTLINYAGDFLLLLVLFSIKMCFKIQVPAYRNCQSICMSI